MQHVKEKALVVKSRITNTGITIFVEGRKFAIEYPRDIWQQTPARLKQLLRENLTFGNTHFLPLTLGYERIQYDIPMPLFESQLFRNMNMDLLKAEGWDHAPHLSYLRQFYNLEFDFVTGSTTLPPDSARNNPKTGQKVAVIPFTFGKESLATLAMCLECGIEPILVYSQEPSQQYEEQYKKKKLKEIGEKYNIKTFFIKNGPGLFRYDAAFQKKPGTEVGWGSQTTMIALQMLPFVYMFDADYMLFGSEYSNNEYEWHNGWKAFLSYDQSTFFTMHQNAMIRLVTNDRTQVCTSLEPIEEVNIFYLLHHRYPELGAYQFSCTAEKPLYPGSQWCHACYKCVRMFLFARVTGVDPWRIGFKKDLLQEPHMFDHYFGRTHKSGSANELDFCFYVLWKKKVTSPYVTQFGKKKLQHLKPWSEFVHEFTTLHPALNLPPEYTKKFRALFQEELRNFKKALSL